MKKDYDLLIIGGGSAGLMAARFARLLDLTVAMVEKDRIGGDRTWSGCVPSKTLLKAAKSAHGIKDAARFGVTSSPPSIDFKSVMGRVGSVVQEIFEAESPDALNSEGIEVIQGEGRFVSPKTVSVDGREINARRYLVCTGAAPAIPPIDGLADVDYLTYETIWELEELPQRLAVVGGGPIGCELAQAFCRLGSSVAVVEAADRVMLQDEPEASEAMAQRLIQDGVDLRLNSDLEQVEQTPNGVRLHLGGEAQIEADRILVSVGRRPQTEGIGLDEAKVAFGPSGVQVNRHLRTSQRNIYAAGDCTGGYQFTHYAGYQGFMAVRNAFLPFNKKSVLEHVPWATFTDPEVAHAGLTEEQARDRHGDKVKATTWPMEQSDRPVTEGDSPGFLKVVHLPNGKLLGATIVSPRAGEMIQEWVLALDQGLTIAHMAESMHVYPTYSISAQQLAMRLRVEEMLGGAVGKFVRKYARMVG